MITRSSTIFVLPWHHFEFLLFLKILLIIFLVIVRLSFQCEFKDVPFCVFTSIGMQVAISWARLNFARFKVLSCEEFREFSSHEDLFILKIITTVIVECAILLNTCPRCFRFFAFLTHCYIVVLDTINVFIGLNSNWDPGTMVSVFWN